MKIIIPILALCLTASPYAAEPVKTPDACCAAGPKEMAACCCEGKSDAKKETCPVCRNMGKGGSAELPVSKDACCESMDPTAFSKESLYQLDASFTTDEGRTFALGELRGQPVVLTMFFASCGYACPLLVADMQTISAQLPAEVRERTRFVLVSFDVARDTPAALKKYRAQRGLDANWTLLHGDDSAVRELAALLGVKYKQEASGMFAHSNLVTVLNAEGEISHQRTGLKGGLDEVARMLAAK